MTRADQAPHRVLLDELMGEPEGEGSVHHRIRCLVLDRILSGEAPPGHPMSVSALAVATGRSRTPVREALLQLQHEKFLTLEQNRGFFVRELTEREARELYPILHGLEDLALVAGGRPARRALERLEDLNRRLAASSDPDGSVALNFAWHAALTEHCGNEELVRLLRRYRTRVYRYERTYYQPGAERIAYSVQLHEEVIEALRAGDLRRARRVLETHWVGDYSLYLPASDSGTIGSSTE